MKLNAALDRDVAIQKYDTTQYIESPAYGVHRLMLDRIGSEKARATTIVKYEPNSKFPQHTHTGGEEFLVLHGTFYDEHGSYPTGTYVRNPIGTSHTPWVENDGCIIFVKLYQMSEYGEPNDSLYLSTSSTTNPETKHQQSNHDNHNDHQHNRNKPNQMYPTVPFMEKDYGKVGQLFHNEKTGELVQMVWLNPYSELPDADGGEEILVVQGSLSLQEVGEEHKQREDELTQWCWLRFPPTVITNKEVNDETNQQPSPPRRRIIKAGRDGAYLYRKTNHLTYNALSLEKMKMAIS